MRRPAPREVAFIVGGIAGVAVFFLPFDDHLSPMRLLTKYWGRDWTVVVAASVFIVPVFVLASTVRQALFGPLTKWEARAAHAVALAALVASSLVALVLAVGTGGTPLLRTALYPSTFILAVGAGVVLAATRRSRVPSSTHAHVAMLVAWMPNTAFLLAVLGMKSGWGPGGYLAVVTLVAYTVEATLRVRASCSGPEAPPRGSPR